MLYSDLVEDIETLETYVTDGYTRAVLKRAADAIEELQSQVDGWIEQERNALLKSISKWIPIEERLPEEWKTVLTFQPTTTDDKGIIQTCVYIGIPGKWRQAWNHEFLELPVTHWMPLPEPPKEETE